MPQPPDLAQIKDWEMKKLLHFAFPDQELEVEWRFIFCERFPGWRALGPHRAGEFRESEKRFCPAACPEISHHGMFPPKSADKRSTMQNLHCRMQIPRTTMSDATYLRVNLAAS